LLEEWVNSGHLTAVLDDRLTDVLLADGSELIVEGVVHAN